MLDKINSNMSIGARLSLVSGLFMASSAIVTALFVVQALDQINFNAKEVEGSEYLSQVWDALQNGGRVEGGALADAFDAGSAVTAFNSASTTTDRVSTGLALMVAVGDGSNLTLDPELDSFYYYVTKPFTAATLKSRIEAVFGALT